MKRVVLAVCVAVLSALAISASARADTVTDWNVNAVGALVGTAGQSPTVSTVHLAMVHGAVYDAVNSIDERYEPYLVDVRARDWYSRDAAAATAAYKVLLAIVPAQAADVGRAVRGVDGRDPRRPRQGQRRARGRDRGGRDARRAHGRRPRRRVPLPGPAPPPDPWPSASGGPCCPRSPTTRARGSRTCGRSSSRTRSATLSQSPHPLTSRPYAREFDEIKAVGALNSTVRTADQTDQARFWAEGPAAVHPRRPPARGRPPAARRWTARACSRCST